MAYADSVSSGPPGLCILKSTSGMYFYRPGWDHVSIIRPLPAPLEDGSGCQPYRKSMSEFDYSPWIESKHIALYIGSMKKVSFIDEVPGQNRKFYQTPLDKLIQTVKSKVKGFGVDYDEYGDAKNNLHPVHPSSPSALIQCIVLNYKGKNYFAEGSPLTNIVFSLTRSAKTALDELLEEENETFSGDPADFINRFKFGNVLDPVNGSVLKIIGQGDASETTASSSGYSIDASSLKKKANSGDSEFKKYQVVIGEKAPIKQEVINRLWKPWDKVLWLMQPDQQVELLCTAFPRNIMRAAFSDTDWLPKSVAAGKTITPMSDVTAPAKTMDANDKEGLAKPIIQKEDWDKCQPSDPGVVISLDEMAFKEATGNDEDEEITCNIDENDLDSKEKDILEELRREMEVAEEQS
jgi:hypothetical protein